MNNVGLERYYVDQLNSQAWLILDNESLETSYNLLLIPIASLNANYQIIITCIKQPLEINNYTLVEYSKELYSNIFYSSTYNNAMLLVSSMLNIIEEDKLDINNLIELAAMFGGLVNNETILLPTITYNLCLN